MGGMMMGQNADGPQGIGFGQITDGSSNTIVLAEQSDWMLNDNGVQVDCRADGNHGFNMGGGRWRTNRWFNVATVRHPVNEKVISRADGAAGNVGPNCPIQSAHPGGATASLADGSVHFLPESTSLVSLFNLADRNDGNVVDVTDL